MKLRCTEVVFAAICIFYLTGADWLQFRGSDYRSVSDDVNLPAHWDTTTNVAWKGQLPGRGLSSPIVVSDRVIVTSSSGVRQDRLHVVCFDSKTGEQLWHRQFWATGRTLTHPTSANAAPTPVSDGQRVIAFYSSNDVICLDLEGNLLWYRGLAHDYPQAGNDIGMSSSPVLIEGGVVFQVQNQGDSFAVALDRLTGESLWRVPLDPIASWSTPTVDHDPKSGKQTVFLQSGNGLCAYDANNGNLRWKYEIGCDGISSPAAVAGRLYLASGGMTLLDVAAITTQPQVVWNESKLNPGAASVIVDDSRLYVVNRTGVVSCANADTGKLLWKMRIEGSFWSTPVVAGDRLYAFNDKGVGQVVQLGAEEGTLISSNDLAEPIQASPAVSDSAIYVRSDQHLWKISSAPQAE